MTFDLAIRVVVHLEPVYIRFVGQDHGSKFKVGGATSCDGISGIKGTDPVAF